MAVNGQKTWPWKSDFIFRKYEITPGRIGYRMNMIACLDVAYGEATAFAAGLTAVEWADANPVTERIVQISNVRAYEPGHFFQRELPCLLAVLKALPPVEVAIVDGYVWLDGGNKPGLGAHLYEALGKRVAVVGIAKTRFKGADAHEVLRGKSNRPLFITAAGMSSKRAVEHVHLMHGLNRIPTLLKRVDNQCRSAKAATKLSGLAE